MYALQTKKKKDARQRERRKAWLRFLLRGPAATLVGFVGVFYLANESEKCNGRASGGVMVYELGIRSPARPWVLRARVVLLRVAPSGLARFAAQYVTQGKTSTPCLWANPQAHAPARPAFVRLERGWRCQRTLNPPTSPLHKDGADATLKPLPCMGKKHLNEEPQKSHRRKNQEWKESARGRKQKKT